MQQRPQPVRIYSPEQEARIEMLKEAGWYELTRFPNGAHTVVVMAPPGWTGAS